MSHSADDVDGQRRRLLGGALAAGALSGLPGAAFGSGGALGAMNVRFTHGVASGDPLSDRVILWTRVRAQDTADFNDVPLQWEIALDAGFHAIVASGSDVAKRTSDFCVKVDAQPLKPGTVYWYRFKAFSAVSTTGRTKTLPVGAVQQVRLAVFSCANYAAGHFNVYAEAVKRMEIEPCDAALHLGDYIYESSADGYASEDAKALGRVVDPASEAIALRDYRRRYAQCRGDVHLQRLHEMVPMIAVWDDHEFANNAWRDGAENHQESEGTFKRRKNAAARAWREWLPVRDTDRRLVNYRGFEFGDLISLNMLDTRIRHRQQQLVMTDYLSPTGVDQKRFFNDLNHQDRDLLGEDQRAWLSNRMKAPQITWMLLGQQVLMARMHVPAPIMQERMRPGSGLSPSAFAALAIKAKTQSGPLTQQEKVWLAQVALPYNLDAWDGYPNCRSRLLDAARIHGSNLVVLTGDTHNAWASDLQDDPGRHIGVEFATPSVTSPGLEVILAGEDPKRVAQLFTQLVEPLKFAETSRRGYLQITATHEECRGDWILVDTVKQRDYTAEVAKSLRVLPGHGNRKLEPIQVGT